MKKKNPSNLKNKEKMKLQSMRQCLEPLPAIMDDKDAL